MSCRLLITDLQVTETRHLDAFPIIYRVYEWNIAAMLRRPKAKILLKNDFFGIKEKIH